MYRTAQTKIMVRKNFFLHSRAENFLGLLVGYLHSILSRPVLSCPVLTFRDLTRLLLLSPLLSSHHKENIF